MAWWSSFFGGKEEEKNAPVIQENASEVIGGLNFKTALEAHIKWKLRLKGVIDGTGTEALDPRVVSQDNQCALGKWIYAEGQAQYGEYPGFQAVVTSHAHFHKCAGHTLELALDGKVQEADDDLATGNFARASHEVSRHLMRLWRDVGIEK
jgi:hypothetical protein